MQKSIRPNFIIEMRWKIYYYNDELKIWKERIPRNREFTKSYWHDINNADVLPRKLYLKKGV